MHDCTDFGESHIICIFVALARYFIGQSPKSMNAIRSSVVWNDVIIQLACLWRGGALRLPEIGVRFVCHRIEYKFSKIVHTFILLGRFLLCTSISLLISGGWHDSAH